MAEPTRLDSSVTADPVDRDSRAEALLVEGLDRYFAGKYDEAIHLWTRVLFFDRSHARARAYIDRARSAMAERQRRFDEMVHRAEDLLAGGQIEQARLLLSQAAASGGDDERAAEMRTRIDRADRARGYAGTSPAAVVDAIPLGPSIRGSSRGARVLITSGAVALALVAGVVVSPVVERWFAGRVSSSGPVAAGVPVSQKILSSSEVALVRARTLYARGRLAEALQALDRVQTDSPGWADADQLRVEIQRILLASRRGLASPAVTSTAGRP
jgi:tetratricopeptide (TPR) repeat protein